MTISNITTTTGTTPQWQSALQQRRQDFSDLSQALQSGDLAGAQQAYNNLQSLQPNNQSGTNSSSSGTAIQNDFAALGQALNSNNLSQAQTAFSQLQSDLKTAFQNPSASSNAATGTSGTHRGHHHHHHGSSSTQDSSSSSTDSTTSTGSQTGTNNGVNVVA